jgi:hypothetical protein
MENKDPAVRLTILLFHARQGNESESFSQYAQILEMYCQLRETDQLKETEAVKN